MQGKGAGECWGGRQTVALNREVRQGSGEGGLSRRAFGAEGELAWRPRWGTCLARAGLFLSQVTAAPFYHFISEVLLPLFLPVRVWPRYLGSADPGALLP